MACVRKRRGRYVADYLDQNGQRHVETPKGKFETLAHEKRAAEALLKKRQSEVDTNAYQPPEDRPTFAAVAKLWIDSKVRLRAASRSDYQITLDCYLVPYFGPRKYESITRLDIEKFRAEMVVGIPERVQRARDEKLRELKAKDPNATLRALDPGPRTTNKCLGVLISIGFYALDHNLATKNVAQRMEKVLEEGDGEESESSVIEENVLTPAELVRAIETAADPWRIPIAISAYCGMREAEVLGLQWRDIDWVRGTAEIRRTQRRGVFSKPKSKASRRTIELPAQLVAELKSWRPGCPNNEHDLVCPSITGLPMQASALLQQGFYPALERAGIRRVRFHDLRHSWASNLLEAGENIATVSKALGHANVYITLKVYAHAIPKARHGVSDRMAALMDETKETNQRGSKMGTEGWKIDAPHSDEGGVTH
jgi:integrase